MSRVLSAATFYVAVWDDLNLVKPGYTSHRRWRDWQIRGARIALLRTFLSHEPAFAVERLAKMALAERWPLAFASEENSRPVLGRCGGWRETYRVDSVADAEAMLRRIAETHCADALPDLDALRPCERPMHVRTYVRDLRRSTQLERPRAA